MNALATTNVIDHHAELDAPPTRLPQAGLTIFATMTALAQRHGAVNLGQGFPDFDCAPALVDALAAALRAGHNQYAPMAGIPSLRRAIVEKIAREYGAQYDPDREVTVTAGATQALSAALLAATQPGDEVIVIEPAYDSYVAAIQMAGAIPRFVAMDDAYQVPWDAVARAITSRTRAIIVNTPHNPSGRVLNELDLQALEALVLRHGLWLIADEVYEHMVFDGALHQSACRYPGLRSRSFVVSSFGKTFHITGWKVGYCVAPAPLMAAFQKIHQYQVFCVHAPSQHAIAAYLADPAPYQQLPAFYQAKRDRFRQALSASRFQLLPCEGTYFQLVDYSAISTQADVEFARWLTMQAGVAAIPVSVFHHEAPAGRQVVRFCFAKRDDTIDEAVARLCTL